MLLHRLLASTRRQELLLLSPSPLHLQVLLVLLSLLLRDHLPLLQVLVHGILMLVLLSI
jgi:hypothetical protein